ncbi:MAG: NAD(+) diphosphatase [Heyndrickxia sp.]
MIYKFCPLCGNELTQKYIRDEGDIPYCNVCKKTFFSFTKHCVLVAIVNEDNQIVLTKQKHIVSNQWVLISGYIKQGETVEETVTREVYEETGQEAISIQYVKSYDIKKHDMLMLGFVVSVMKRDFLISTEIDEISWFTFAEATRVILKDSIAEELLNDVLKIRK